MDAEKTFKKAIGIIDRIFTIEYFFNLRIIDTSIFATIVLSTCILLCLEIFVVKNQENIKIIQDAMYSSSNEPGGTSYGSRLEDKRFTFAGKTGSSQIKKFTEEQREAEVKQESLDYKSRDHALFVAYAPVNDPKYAISVVVEHGGSGSKAAAPIAKKVIKKVLERHNLRQSILNLQGDSV